MTEKQTENDLITSISQFSPTLSKNPFSFCPNTNTTRSLDSPDQLSMSQCVPNWDVDDDAPNASHPRLSFTGVASASAAAAMSPPGPDLSSVDYEVAELTWENGQLSMQCLGNSRLNTKPTATVGTLESLVNQATSVGNNAIPPAGCKPSYACAAELVPWFDPSKAPTDVVATASTTMTMDVLVPCTAATGTDDPHRQAVWLLGDSVAHGPGACGCCSTHVGSCSAMGGGNGLLNPEEEEQRQEGSRKRTSCSGGDSGDHHSASDSATYSHPVTTQDTYESEMEPENATSQGSPEKMSCGKGGKGRATTAATTEEHDTVYSRPRREAEEKRRSGKSSLSTRRSRAAAIHNQSERKRRDKINQKMKTLQKLVPNSSKTDKASVLDEVIDYLKQLQAQVQMMSRMNVPVPPMMLPMTLQQQLQLSMMMPMGLGLGLAGMPGVMAGDMSGLSGNPPNIPGIPPSPPVLHPFMPVFPWDGTPGDRFASGPAATVTPDLLSAFLASQSSPAMTLDAYSRFAAMYHQQMRQQPPSNPNN